MNAKVYKYQNATIYVNGTVDREILRDATIQFMRKVIEERSDHGYSNTSGNIDKEQVLD